MQCDRAQDLIAPFVDRELSVALSRELMDHVRSCPPCNEELQMLRAIHSQLHRVPKLECPSSVWTGLSERIEASPPPVSVRKSGPAVTPAWALAAALLASSTLLWPDHHQAPIYVPQEHQPAIASSSIANLPTSHSVPGSSLLSRERPSPRGSAVASANAEWQTSKPLRLKARVHSISSRATHLRVPEANRYSQERRSSHNEVRDPRKDENVAPALRSLGSRSPSLVANRLDETLYRPIFGQPESSPKLRPDVKQNTRNAGAPSTGDLDHLVSVAKTAPQDSRTLDDASSDCLGMGLELGAGRQSPGSQV